MLNTYLTEAATELFPADGVVGSLLIIEPWVLGLNGSQSQLNGLIKKIPKHLEPVASKAHVSEQDTSNRLRNEEIGTRQTSIKILTDSDF